MLKPGFILIIFLLSDIHMLAQESDGRIFEFINLPGNARLAALGGKNISWADNDVNMVASNPALIEEEWDNYISFTHLYFLADISLNSLSYAKSIQNTGTWALSINYLNYGEFDQYDESGFNLGKFNASDYYIMIGRSHTLGNFTVGANLKYAASEVERYQANSLMLDLGGVYTSGDGNFRTAILIKNFGFIISDYLDYSSSNLPFDVQVGMTIKPEHMPARFTITGYNLMRGDLIHNETENNNRITGIVDNILSHLTIGTEILISKNFNIRGGYNHLINKELSLENNSGGAGFTFGLMVRIKSFEFAYSRALYHVAGGGNYFTLTSNLNHFFKKEKNE